MLKSMTGYGTAKGTVAGQQVSVEIRSLNSKFLELNLRLPALIREKETEIRTEIGRRIDRGKADLFVNIEGSELSRRSTINRELFAAYLSDIKELSSTYSLNEDGILDTVLRMPLVLNSDKADLPEDSWMAFHALILGALERFNAFREEEGKVLEADLRSRINSITRLQKELEPYEIQRIEAIRNRIKRNMADIKEITQVDENRFEQELIYYIEKLDISEEKVRLKAHCDYFLETLNSPEAGGKKLGFIVQEIGREINTTGAKANDAMMQKIVVLMKEELEKLKEQLANVL